MHCGEGDVEQVSGRGNAGKVLRVKGLEAPPVVVLSLRIIQVSIVFNHFEFNFICEDISNVPFYFTSLKVKGGKRSEKPRSTDKQVLS